MINPYGASFVLKENEDNADQYKNFAGLYAAGIDNPVLVEFIDAYNLPALGDPAAQQACKIEFDLRYAFANRALEAAISPVFDRIANSLVDSFVKRAEQVHGPR